MSLYFIYGTLKKDMKNHSVLEDCKAKFITEVLSEKKYPMFDLGNGFPYIQDKSGIGFHISGELYEIKDCYQKKLDYFEGVPDLYKRGTIKIQGNLGCFVSANCYFIVDELNEVELNEVEFLRKWKENNSKWNFENYFNKE